MANEPQPPELTSDDINALLEILRSENRPMSTAELVAALRAFQADR